MLELKKEELMEVNGGNGSVDGILRVLEVLDRALEVKDYLDRCGCPEGARIGSENRFKF